MKGLALGWGRETRIQVSLDKKLNFPSPQSLHLWNRDNCLCSWSSLEAGGKDTHWPLLHAAHQGGPIEERECQQESRKLCSFLFCFFMKCQEKAMAPHSSTLAWKIPWMEEPGGLQSMGSRRVLTWLSDFTFTFHFHALEKEMAIHSSGPGWRIPGMGEPGGLLSVGSHRVGQDWGDLAAAAAAEL